MPVLEITTMIGCPLKCTFCPQDALTAAYPTGDDRYLSLSNFTRALSTVPSYVRIDFSGMAEPWANAQATDMLQHALQREFRVAIYTTLGGMSVHDAKRVIGLITAHASQVEEIVLHLPDGKMNMRGWRDSDEYRQVLTDFLALEPRPRASRGVEVMTMDRRGDVHPQLKHLALRLQKWEGHSRAGSLNPDQAHAIGARPAPRNDCAVSCASTPFYDHNVLVPNGDVVLCCMDYSLKHKIGNLFRQDYAELFLSPELAQLRAENAKPAFSKCSICKSCDNVVRYGLSDSAWVVEGANMSVRRAARGYLIPSVRAAIRRRLT